MWQPIYRCMSLYSDCVLMLPVRVHNLRSGCISASPAAYRHHGVDLSEGHWRVRLRMRRAGDQIGNLWWRLLHGELPVSEDTELSSGKDGGKAPRVVFVLIGTNDLGAADCHRNATELLEAVPGIVQRCVHGHSPHHQLLSLWMLGSGCLAGGFSFADKQPDHRLVAAVRGVLRTCCRARTCCGCICRSAFLHPWRRGVAPA